MGWEQAWQTEADCVHTSNKANTSIHTVSKEPNEIPKKIPQTMLLQVSDITSPSWKKELGGGGGDQLRPWHSRTSTLVKSK